MSQRAVHAHATKRWTLIAVMWLAGLGAMALAMAAYTARVPTYSLMYQPRHVTDQEVAYSHIDGMYSLKYPAFLEKSEFRVPNSACKTSVVLATSFTAHEHPYLGDIGVNVCPVAEPLFPQAAFSNIQGDVKPITVDGRKGFLKTGVASINKLGVEVNIKRIAIYRDGMEYTMDLYYFPGAVPLDDVFNQIVASFRFT